MEKDEKLTEALSQLERDVKISLASANSALADGLRPLLKSPLTVEDLSTGTYNARWRWQDQLARVMREYVRRLHEQAERYQVPSASTWIGLQLRNRFRVLVEQQLESDFDTGLVFEPALMSLSQLAPEDRRDLGAVAQREPRRSPRLRGELIIFRGDMELRIPVVVSAQVRFLESFVLRPVKRNLSLNASPANSAALHGNQPWLFQKHRGGWSVGSNDRLFEFRDLLGMTYLRTLLRNPGIEIPVEQLAESARATTTSQVRDADVDALGIGQAEQELLDDQAKREYRQSVKQLQRDAEIATELGDTQTMAKITGQLEFLHDELKRATAIRGRTRRFATSGERLRVSVRKSTVKAVEMISLRMPDIGEHLKASISFGFKCCYRPVQRRTWQF